MDTTKLTDHIISTVYEGLIKLGTTGNENYSIYYDLDLVNHLLDASYENNQGCYEDLLAAYEHPIQISGQESPLTIRISLEKGRFRFTVMASSIPSILSRGESNSFLKEIIELVKSHHFTIEDVKQLFSRYSNDYTCETTNHPEFQYVLYFNQKEINQYKYCFTFDGCCGGYYHRLLDYDYQKLLLEE